MKFKPYPRYKDSGIEWLGEVPEHWDIKRIKQIISPKKGAIKTGPFGSQLQSSEMLDGKVKVYNQRSIIDKDFLSGENYISFEKFNELRAFEVFPNDLLITTRGTIGRCAVFPINAEKGILHPCLMRIQLNSRIALNRFIEILIQFSGLILEQLKLESNATTIDVIYSETLKEVWLALPPLCEQATISNFLDRETHRIDTLIEEKNRFIELLKEKRQALISHAVTKGLDPTVKMKDSGVEWLGEVPEHWNVTPLKHQCSLLKDGTHLPPQRVDVGVPLLSVRNIDDDKFYFRDDDSMISEESYQNLCKAFIPFQNDVLLAVVGATLGKTALVPVGFGKFHIQRSVAIFRPSADMESKWLNFVFQSQRFQQLLWEYAGYSAQPGIYLGTLANFRIPLAPKGQQIKIISFLENETAKISGLIQETQNSIALLKEHRTALISAAVTGKIDVR